MSAEGAAWSDRGADALRRGEFDAALRAYESARAEAVGSGDLSAVDRADLNIAMVRLQMGDLRAGEDGLREILLRTPDSRLAFAAAYNLASSLRRQGRFDKAMRYARRALERAEREGSADLVAPVRNLFGNILLGQGHLEAALEAYEGSLRLRQSQTEDTSYSRAILEENIGYCLLLKGDRTAGMARIRGALELADHVGDRRCRAECLQDLCYGHLLAGELVDAATRGDEALAEATLHAYGDIIENCHYLLGEIGVRSGDVARRDRHFDALQRLHPDLPFLRDFLCAVDITTLITLKR